MKVSPPLFSSVFLGLVLLSGCVGPSQQARPNSLVVVEAESAASQLTGSAGVRPLQGASGGKLINRLGFDSTLEMSVPVDHAGTYTTRIDFINGMSEHSAKITVNDTAVQAVKFPTSGSWESLSSIEVKLPLKAGTNSVRFSDPDDWLADIDRIAVLGASASQDPNNDTLPVTEPNPPTTEPVATPPVTEPEPVPQPPVAPQPIQPQPSSGRVTWEKLWTWGMQHGDFAEQYARDAIGKASLDMAVVGQRWHWGPADVQRIKANKLLITYLNLGEASLWEPLYPKAAPLGLTWGTGTDCLSNPVYNGSNLCYVKFWEDAWQRLVLDDLTESIRKGFDGVFMDTLDVYWNTGYPGGVTDERRSQAVDFLCRIHDHVKAINPNFKLIVNNGLELINYSGRFAQCTDAVVAEGFWYREWGRTRPQEYRDFLTGPLNRMRDAGKKIFIIDYPGGDLAAEQDLAKQARGQGWLPFGAFSAALDRTPTPLY